MDLVSLSFVRKNAKKRKLNEFLATATLPMANKQSFDQDAHAVSTKSNYISRIGSNENSIWFYIRLGEIDKSIDGNTTSIIST